MNMPVHRWFGKKMKTYSSWKFLVWPDRKMCYYKRDQSACSKVICEIPYRQEDSFRCRKNKSEYVITQTRHQERYHLHSILMGQIMIHPQWTQMICSNHSKKMKGLWLYSSSNCFWILCFLANSHLLKGNSSSVFSIKVYRQERKMLPF